jgi:hypothetical protein
VRLREEIQEMLRRGDGELSGLALCLTTTVRNVLRKPQAREGAARGYVPVWACEVGDRLRERLLQKLERSLPRCLGARWIVHLGAGFVHERVVRLVAIDLEL